MLLVNCRSFCRFKRPKRFRPCHRPIKYTASAATTTITTTTAIRRPDPTLSSNPRLLHPNANATTSFKSILSIGMPSKSKPRKKTKAQKAAAQEARYDLILEAADRVVRILNSRGISCAVFGSLASRLYGASRCPNVSPPSLFTLYCVLYGYGGE